MLATLTAPNVVPIHEGDRTLFTNWPEPKPAKTGELETLIVDMQHGAQLTSEQLLQDINAQQIAIAAMHSGLVRDIAQAVQQMAEAQTEASARASHMDAVLAQMAVLAAEDAQRVVASLGHDVEHVVRQLQVVEAALEKIVTAQLEELAHSNAAGLAAMQNHDSLRDADMLLMKHLAAVASNQIIESLSKSFKQHETGFDQVSRELELVIDRGKAWAEWWQEEWVQRDKLDASADFIYGWADSIAGGLMKWYRQTFYDHDPANYDSGMYQVGSIFGMIHGLLLGFASGGCAGGWALTAARWYERSMTAWGMTQAVYNYYEGKATWWDALAFLPAAGWGARKIGNGLGIFRACFVGDTLVLVRPMPEGTTQAVATSGAGQGNADRLIAMGAGGFCIVAAAGIALTEVKRRRKNRQQQRRDQIDEFFARDDQPCDPEDPQDAVGERWMEELADPAHEPLDGLCDRLFLGDDADWRTGIWEGAPAEPSLAPLCPVSDRGTNAPLRPVSDQKLWPVSDRATSPTAGLPQPTSATVAVLDKPVTTREAETRGHAMSSEPTVKARPEARKKRRELSLRWLVLAALTVFGSVLLSWGLSAADSHTSNASSSPATVIRPQPKYETRAIRDIRTGHRVMADNPELAGQQIPELHIDPETWRDVVLQMTKEDGGLLDIVLLWPLEWIDAHDAQVGGTIHLDLEEFGAVGPARVVSIDPCPPIEDGAGRIVTATFAHSAGDILDICVEGLTQPIGTTANHAWWSEDRQAFVAAGVLQIGEQLRLADGAVTSVASITPRTSAQPVYNLEVDGGHVYYVSATGVLVHNTCVKGLRGILLGEYQPRVIAAAKHNGFRFWPARNWKNWVKDVASGEFSPTASAKNMRWLRDQIRRGESIFSLGKTTGRGRGPYYREEVGLLLKSGYRRRFKEMIDVPGFGQTKLYEWIKL
ncbi:MAG: hypothetical protein ISR77_04970 [Pirellulaceae bacterium]|nr:hypothetical protein [Pirellulaceae bacterium]